MHVSVVFRRVKWNKCRNLVEVRSKSHEAVFDIMHDGKRTGQTEIFKVMNAVYCWQCSVMTDSG